MGRARASHAVCVFDCNQSRCNERTKTVFFLFTQMVDIYLDFSIKYLHRKY